VIALPLSSASQAVLREIPHIALSAAILLLVMGLGIVFDVIGVAVTAARLEALNARASRRVYGSRRAVQLVQNAHAVASFCNDVVGDVTGTLSGAIGTAIVYQVFASVGPMAAVATTTGMSAFVAAAIVAGKAYGKVFGIRSSTEIVGMVGCVLEAVDSACAIVRR